MKISFRKSLVHISRLENFNHPFIIFLLLYLIMMLVLGTDLSHIELTANDGSSYFCSLRSWVLFHPGTYQALPCTYDHQPFYFLFLKFIMIFTKKNLNLIRHVHLIILVANSTLFFHILVRLRVSTILSLLAAVFLITSPFNVRLNLQIRMYGLYSLSVLILLYYRLFSSLDSKRARFALLLGYLNFIFILLPLSAWHILDLVKDKGKSLKNKIHLYYWLILLFLVKVYYVYFHRIKNRGTGDWYKQYSLQQHIKELIYPILGYDQGFQTPIQEAVAPYFILAIVLGIFIAFRNNKQKMREILFVSGFSYFVLIFIRFVVKIDEIEYRYILFVTPFLIISSLASFKKKYGIGEFVAAALFLVAIFINISWVKNYYNSSANRNDRFLPVRDFLNAYHPDILYSFKPIRDEDYIFSYQDLLFDKKVKILDFQKSMDNDLLFATNYVIVEQKIPKPPNLPNLQNEFYYFSELMAKHKGTYKLLFCIQGIYPDACFYQTTLPVNVKI